MIFGIVLIVIGVIGSILTLIIGIKFMKKNNIIFKSEYVELKNSDNGQKNYSVDMENRNEDNNDTMLLDNNNDTMLLDDNNNDTMLLND